MYSILMILHVIFSVALIVVILSQSGKGGALDGLVGGTASNMLGGQTASGFLKNATKTLAVLFMVTSILLAFQVRGGRPGRSAVDRMRSETERTQPVEQPTQETPAEVPAAPFGDEFETEEE
jgi:preprotein translocase subunit SecG